MSLGKVVQIIGSVVDIQFPQDAVPSTYDILHLTDDEKTTTEVQQILGGGIVRTIALENIDKFALELSVKNTGRPKRVNNIDSPDLDEITKSLSHEGASTELLHPSTLLILDAHLSPSPLKKPKTESQVIQLMAVGAGISKAHAARLLKGFKEIINPPKRMLNPIFDPEQPFWQNTRKGEGKVSRYGHSKHYGNRR